MLVRSTIVELRRAEGASALVLRTVQECLEGDDPVKALAKFSETDRWLEEDAMEEAESPGGVTADEACLWSFALRYSKWRAHVRVRGIALFWQEATEKRLCAEGGATRATHLAALAEMGVAG